MHLRPSVAWDVAFRPRHSPFYNLSEGQHFIGAGRIRTEYLRGDSLTCTYALLVYLGTRTYFAGYLKGQNGMVYNITVCDRAPASAWATES